MTQREERLAKLLDSGRKGYGMPVQATDVSILLRYAVDLEAENERLREHIGASGIAYLEQLRARVAELEAENERLRAENDTFSQQNRAWIRENTRLEARGAVLEEALRGAMKKLQRYGEQTEDESAALARPTPTPNGDCLGMSSGMKMLCKCHRPTPREGEW